MNLSMEPAAFDLTTFSSEEDIESCGSSRRGRSRHVPHKELPAEVVDRRNERERRRVTAVNAEFRTLQKLLPTLKARTRRVSKEKILICALDYIKGLQRMIKEHNNVMDNMGVVVSQEPNMTCSDPWGGEQRWLQNTQRPFHYTHPRTEVMPDEPSPQPECCVPPGHCSHQRRVVGGLHMPALQDALGRQELSVPQDGGRQCQADSAVFSKYTPNYNRPCMRDITHSLNNAYNIQVGNSYQSDSWTPVLSHCQSQACSVTSRSSCQKSDFENSRQGERLSSLFHGQGARNGWA